jgi:hypothetical protein
MRGLDQDQATRIKAEAMAAVTMRTAVFAKPIGRHDEKKRPLPRQAGQQRRDEAEGRGGAAVLGRDLMQGPAGKAALRQATIDGGKAERKNRSG